MSGDPTTSATLDLWVTARAAGALSLGAYHRALETASILDVGADALARVGCIVACADLSSADALGAVRDARLVQITVCAAGARVQGHRRRAFIDPSVATPPALQRSARQCLEQLRGTISALDPAANPLLGALAGTAGAATRALVETDPLFTHRLLSSANGSISLDEVDELIDALHECLVGGFRHVASQRSIPVRAVARARRFAGLAPEGRWS